ncbi:hypothetical protein NDU88_003438 [Pleurodeles waltl]|uniref:Uncharacterized protein n=1 Tax=Pleurodeles waltl TaxID=8319 RepID=A0AAV7MQJ1_PLEWA|nr:hypothetical protein NDU88_003438 [Pleurodeles waltl]
MCPPALLSAVAVKEIHRHNTGSLKLPKRFGKRTIVEGFTDVTRVDLARSCALRVVPPKDLSTETSAPGHPQEPACVFSPLLPGKGLEG